MRFPLTTGTVDDHGMNQEPTRTVAPDGTQQWWVAGQLHRLDGPAYIRASGTQQWWVAGQNITHKIETWMRTQEVTWPWDEQTHMMFLLTWA